MNRAFIDKNHADTPFPSLASRLLKRSCNGKPSDRAANDHCHLQSTLFADPIAWREPKPVCNQNERI
jgi:hypothetical protein